MCLTQCSRQKSNSAVKGWPYWKRVDKEVPENGRRTGGGMLREFRKEARVWGRWWMLLPPVERKLNMLQSISQKLGRVAKLEGEEMEEAEGCQLPPRYQRREMSYCAIFAREWKICRTSLRIAFIIPLLLLLLLFFSFFFMHTCKHSTRVYSARSFFRTFHQRNGRTRWRINFRIDKVLQQRQDNRNGVDARILCVSME